MPADLVAELERAYRDRFATFLRVALAVVGDEHLARDAVQDAFVRAIRHRRGFRAESSLDGWLWRIVLNEARKRRAAASRVVATDPSALREQAGRENGHGDSARVAELVATLPERQRLALFLRYYADLDYRAIAEALDVAPGTVGATLNAAQSNLRARLEEVGAW